MFGLCAVAEMAAAKKSGGSGGSGGGGGDKFGSQIPFCEPVC